MKSMTNSYKIFSTSPSFRLVKSYRQNGLVEGVSTLLRVNERISNKFNTQNSDEEADTFSISSDWRAVGQDMHAALNKYATQK